MKNYVLDVIPIDLRGTVVKRFKGASQSQHYKAIASLFTGIAEADIRCLDYTSIPVGIDYIIGDRYIRTQLQARLQRTVAEDECRIVLIDMLTPNANNIYFGMGGGHVPSSIQNLANQYFLTHADTHTGIILVPTLLTDFGGVVSPGPSGITADNLVVVDEVGNFEGKLADAAHFNAEEYRDILRRNSPGPHEIARRKIVRRIGNFEFIRANGATSYTHIFYDCSYCVDELGKILMKYINDNNSADDVVLWHCQDAEWMSNLAQITTDKLASTSSPVHLFANVGETADKIREKLDDLLSDCSPSQILVILPMCDTGALAAFYNDLIRRATHFSGELKFLSVLSCSGMDPFFGTIKTIYRVEVSYIIRVPQRATADWLKWRGALVTPPPQGSLNIRDDIGKLSSFAWWYMAKEVEFRKEDLPTQHRADYGYLPDIKQLVKLNGPWLALKFHNMMAFSSTRSVNRIIVCPDEEGASALTGCLNELLRYDVVKIPRNTILTFDTQQSKHEARALIEELFNDEEWYVTLSTWKDHFSNTYGHGNHIVMADKFIISGKMFEGMYKILSAMELPIVAFLTVVNFGDQVKANGIEFISLYDIDY
jgi:hypothetical protein